MVLLVCTYYAVTFTYINTAISTSTPHLLYSHLSYSACILTLLPLSYHPLLSLSPSLMPLHCRKILQQSLKMCTWPCKSWPN